MWLGLYGITADKLTLLASLIILLAIGAAVLAAVLFYVSAIGVYSLSEKCGIEKPWYSFIPFFNAFALGRLADNCGNRRRSGKGAVLLVLYSAAAAAALICIYTFISAGMKLWVSADLVAVSSGTKLPDAAFSGFPAAFLMTGVFILMRALYLVFYYICLWRIYNNFAGKNAIVYFIISLLIGITARFFIYSLRTREPANLNRHTGGDFQDGEM